MHAVLDFLIIWSEQMCHAFLKLVKFTSCVTILSYFPTRNQVHVLHNKKASPTSHLALFSLYFIADLLELQPLPVTALEDPSLEALYPFEHFNPIQTQIFHCLYHTDNNMLLGAPTGSGKTVAAEIAMFRVFRVYPGSKVSEMQFIEFIIICKCKIGDNQATR
jgi:Superfamily II helicase